MFPCGGSWRCSQLRLRYMPSGTLSVFTGNGWQMGCARGVGTICGLRRIAARNAEKSWKRRSDFEPLEALASPIMFGSLRKSVAAEFKRGKMLRMKRVRRPLFHVLLILSLLLCLATILIRFISWMENGLGAECRGHQYRLVLMMNDAGCVGTSLRIGDSDPFDGDAGVGIFFDQPFYNFTKHDPQWDGSRYSNSIYRVHLSYWYLVLAFATLPAICLAWILTRAVLFRPFPDNVCKSCGYDLRATPDRCPECGTVHQKKEVISN
jgi:hypothetical protein